MTRKGYGWYQLFMVNSRKKYPMAVTVGIVEDHEEFKKSLVFLVSSVSDYRVLWSNGSVDEAMTNKEVPDVLLLDINLPRKGVFENLSLC